MPTSAYCGIYTSSLHVHSSTGGESKNLTTLTMVFILVGVVKGVFICFALMAVCYRYSDHTYISAVKLFTHNTKNHLNFYTKLLDLF